MCNSNGCYKVFQTTKGFYAMHKEYTLLRKISSLKLVYFDIFHIRVNHTHTHASSSHIDIHTHARFDKAFWRAIYHTMDITGSWIFIAKLTNNEPFYYYYYYSLFYRFCCCCYLLLLLPLHSLTLSLCNVKCFITTKMSIKTYTYKWWINRECLFGTPSKIYVLQKSFSMYLDTHTHSLILLLSNESHPKHTCIRNEYTECTEKWINEMV